MPDTMTSFRVGDVLVDPETDELRKPGEDSQPVKLEPRSMRLLLCLAQRAGRVVSVDELLSLVWKDVVVTPDSVYNAIAGLRRALGDDPRNPRYIDNVVRRGYRLIAPVSWNVHSAAADVEGPPDGASGAPAVVRPSGRNVSRSAGIVAALILALGLGAFYLSHREGKPPSTAAATQASAARAGAGSERSLAVLPFLDLSENHDQGYFADGMAEELVDRLTRVPELRIPARTSSFYFRGKQATLAEIAAALNVRHVLEGSVRKAGDRLRITADLIRVDTGDHVWSQTFDRPAVDIFKIQDEISSAVVQSLRGPLLGERAPVMAGTAANSAAYSLLLKARAIEDGGETADFQLAIQYLKQALTLDPNYAEAWAEWAHVLLSDYDWHDGFHQDICDQARSHAQQAVGLAPDLPDGHRSLAVAMSYCDWDWPAAQREMQRALALNPRNADTLRQYAFLAYPYRQYDIALDAAQQAVSLDPLNDASYGALSFALGVKHRYPEAVAALRKAIEISPTAAGLHGLLTNALLGNGEAAAAARENEREPDEAFRRENSFLIDEAMGRKEQADREVEDFYRRGGDRNSVALFYACRGQTDRAIKLLEQVVAEHNQLDTTPNREECFKKLEGDPRYLTLLRRLRIPGA